MATKQQGAGLDPSQHQGGGMIADGDYDIKTVTTALFTYQGNVPEGVPAILVTYSADGADYEVKYKAGDNAHLIPSEDGTTFYHPEGGTAAIFKGGEASMWLASLAKAGHKFVGESVKQFEGMRVTLETVAAPKGRSSENKDRTFPLVTKILAVAGKKAQGRPTAAATQPKTAQPAASSNGQGDLDEATIAAVQVALSGAENSTLTRIKLGTVVWLTEQKTKNPQAINMKKLVTDGAWLQSHAEDGGWTTDGETITLG